MRLSDYGSGSVSGTAAYLLAVEADGDVMELGLTSVDTISDDSLDYSDFIDAMNLDASTSITADGTEVLSIVNTGTGNSLLVNDEAGDASPFVIDAAGLVGIGDTTPDARLDVEGGSMRLSDYGSGSVTGTAAYLLAVEADGDVVELGLTSVDTVADDSLDYVDFEDAMDLDASTSITADGTEVLSIVNTGTGNSFLVEDEASVDGTPFVIDAAGLVGIGTASPTEALTVAGNLAFTGNATISTPSNSGILTLNGGSVGGVSSAIVFQRGGSTIMDLEGGSSYVLKVSPGSNSAIDGIRVTAAGSWTGNYLNLINAGSTTIFTVNSSENVGIGDATPDAKLDVEGGSMRLSDYGSGSVSGTAAYLLAVEADGDVMELGLTSVDTVADDSLDYADFEDAMDLDASTSITADNAEVLSIVNTGTGNSFLVNDEAGDASPFVIDAAGLVGIGDTTPDAKLDVEGGSMRLSDYGSGTVTGTAAYLLAVEADGDVMEYSLASIDAVADDSLDYVDFEDAMDLDASTSITADNAEVLSIVNTGTGNSFLVNDEAGDASPFVIDAAGLVGIGTATPSYPFSVISDEDGGRVAYFESTASSYPNTQLVLNSPTGYNSGYIWQENDSDKLGLFYNANQSSGGRITDTFEVYSFVSSAPIFQIHESASANSFVISSASNVGIGVASPAAKLDIDAGSNTTGIRLRGLAETTEIGDIYMDADGPMVFSTVNGSASYGLIDLRPRDSAYGVVIRESDGTGLSTYANLFVTDAADDYLTIGVNSGTDGDALNVTAANEVGIGSSDPDAKLDVVGDMKLQSADNLTLEGVAQTNRFLALDNTATPYVNLAHYSVTDAQSRGTISLSNSVVGWHHNFMQLMVHGSTFASDHYLGDGTTEAGVAMLLAQGSEINKLAIGTYDADPLALFTNNAQRLFIESDGDIGIGDATPDARLDVEGGSMRLSDYGGGTVTGTAAYLLAVEADGDVIEYNLASVGGGGSPGGLDTHVQFNDGGSSFGGDAGLTYNKTTDSLTIAGDLTVTGDDITMGTNTAGYLLVADGTNYNPVAMSGDATISGAGALAIAADVLDFPDFADAMALDASTSITADNAEVLSIVNTGTGNSFLVGDEAADASPFVIDAAGNVGIGTASPGQTLDVTGFVNASTGFITPVSGGGLYLSNATFGVFNSSSTLAHLANWNDGTKGISIDTSSGDVGIGDTTPDAKLDVEGGSMRLSDYGAGSVSGTAAYLLAVEADGDIIEYNLASVGGSPGGLDTHVQFNDGGSTFGGDAGLTYNKTTDSLTVGGALTATGAPGVIVGNGATSAGMIQINEDSDDGSNNATFTVPALAADTDYTLPADDGDAGEFLQTDGAGVMSWAAAAGGGGLTPTAVKTANYTAAVGEYVLADTTSGVITVTAPASPSAGDRFGVGIVDLSSNTAFVGFGAEPYYGNASFSDIIDIAQWNSTIYIYANSADGWMVYARGSENGIATASLSGAQSYTTPGSYTWYPPKVGIRVSAVCVGGGGGGSTTNSGAGGGGGGLGYVSSYTITAADVTNGITVVVGSGGAAGAVGNQSYFKDATTCMGNGGGFGSGTGTVGVGGTYAGDGGGNGGNGGAGGGLTYGGGGGGAGGYSGNGGSGNGGAGSGGGGGAGATGTAGGSIATGGGGVGILGEGASGAGGTAGVGGKGGSGGNNATNAGGAYGGAGAGKRTSSTFAGAGGAVRIIWDLGTNPTYPSGS